MAERSGTQLRVPRPVLPVDTREQDPLDFRPFAGWFAGVKKTVLGLGDYSIEGMEDRCVVERRSLSDLARSFEGDDRRVFLRRLRLMAVYPDRMLLVDAPPLQVKAPYEFSGARPNQIVQSLMATIVGLRIQVLCADTHMLGAELVAWFLFDAHMYHWLDEQGFDRVLVDGYL